MDEELRVVTFLDLVELLAVRGFREQGVPLRHIRIAAEQAAEIFQTTHPLAAHRFETDGRHIFARLQAEGVVTGLASLSEGGQWVFPEAVERYLRQLDFHRETDLAIRWWPTGKDRFVVIDPKVDFGAPHISGTGVPTAALYEPVAAGDDPEVVAGWFEVESDQVKAAFAYEQELRAA